MVSSPTKWSAINGLSAFSPSAAFLHVQQRW
jgi:hypothetical protein